MVFCVATMRGVPQEKTVRARRIFCSNRNNRRKGCGRTFSVWVADKNPAAEPLGRLSVGVFFNRWLLTASARPTAVLTAT